MFDKMKELMEMKSQADRIKKELDRARVEISAVNGIDIVINGSQNFQSITIDQALVKAENTQKLESDLLTSINKAIKESQNVAAQKMKEVMPGFPGM